MKKLTLSVAALTIAMMSYGQSTEMVPNESILKTKCKALTTDSVQCKNNTKAKNSLCYLHNPYYKDEVKVPAKVCTGTTKSGRNCKNKTKNTNQLCYLHTKKD
mgnify:CR=1 FL=1|tara:strand:+ start:727 stop:1035 length:309 start_codon:yes stop_codon:yes gene_type:complete